PSLDILPGSGHNRKRIESGMIIEILVFESEQAIAEFCRNRILCGKTPLSVGGNFGGEQFSVGAFDDCSIRFIEQFAWKAESVGQKQDYRNRSFDWVAGDNRLRAEKKAPVFNGFHSVTWCPSPDGSGKPTAGRTIFPERRQRPTEAAGAGWKIN